MTTVQQQHQNLHDPIISLPTDKEVLSPDEHKTVELLFRPVGNSTLQTIIQILKQALLPVVLFVALSVPQSDQMIQQIFPNRSTALYISIKTILFMTGLGIILYIQQQQQQQSSTS